MNSKLYGPDYFNNLAEDIHQNENKKWWYDVDGNKLNIDDTQLIMLIVSEISEAMEAHRKNLMDDKLPHRHGIEAELADVIIRLLDRMIGMNLVKFRKPYNSSKSIEIFENEGVMDNKTFLKGLYDITHQLFVTHSYFCVTEKLVYDVLDFSYKNGYDLIPVIEEKRIYNNTRTDHLPDERSGKNGKKY